MSIKKYATSILFLIIIMFGNVYAYTNSNYTSFESASSSGYSKVTSDVYFNQLMVLQNVKVKFTQDENNYIFHITGSSSLNVYKDVVVTSIRSSSGAVAPMLYKTANFGNNMYVEESSKTPFADFTGTLNSSSTVKVGSTIIDHFEERYNVDSEGHKKNYTSDSTGNGDKYFIPNSLRDYLSTRTYNFRNSTKYPFKSNNNGIGVSILQNSSNCTYSRNDVVQDGNKCIDYCYFNVNTKISINKSYIDDYRHVCFAQTYTLATSSSNSSLSASVRGISICTQTIDLKEYVECNHNWSIHIEDKTNHYKYCENCEWKITESHELLYEYDGIKHNVCICSYIDKVNYQFKIHDDFIEEVTETLDTDAEYIKYEFQHKTGYKFMHYDVYEKRFVSDVNLSTISNALKTVFIATTSELADRTSILSQIYEAKYEPIKFTIYYNNKNNKQIELDETIDSQIIEYDEVAYLRNNIHCVGYLFKGWSFVEEGDSVDLLPHCEMTNYTATDGYEINLYPVYENLNFKIVYSAGGGHFSDGSKYKEVDYTYYDDNELEKVFSNNSALYFKWYVDDKGNKFSNMSDVKNYVERNGAENITLNLFPIFGRIEVGGSGRANGGGPGGNGAGGNGSGGNGPGGNGAGGSGGVGPGYDVLPSESYDNQNSDDENISSENNYFPYIVPFSNSEIANSSEEDDENEENVTDGAVIATLSFIIKEDTPDVNQYSKWNVLLLFIKNNLFICVFGGIALLLLLIIYEIIIISRFRRSFNTLRD